MGLSMKEVSDDDSSQVFNNWLQGPPETPKPTTKRTHQQILQPAEPLNCPRCNSSNTKFCYYNNYNRTQPRHFCKACKRHWTKGGTLRNVPVGGGRKNKRHKASHQSSETTNKINPSIFKSLYNQDHQLSFLDHDDNALMYNSTTDHSFMINHSDHQLPLQLPFSGTINHRLTPNININIDQKLENYMEDQSSSVINPGININKEAWEFEVAEGSNNNLISSLSSSSSVLMELPSSSYWNWNEFDTTVGDFSIPNWDGTEIKP